MEQLQEDQIKVTVLYGELRTVIQPPKLIEIKTKRKFRFDKIEYWIELEYIKIGPYKFRNQAEYSLNLHLLAQLGDDKCLESFLEIEKNL